MLTKKWRYRPPGRVIGVWITLLLLCMWLHPFSVMAQEDLRHVAPGTQVVGNVATASRDILVEGTVLGDVTSISGDIIVTGYVQGDVISYSGSIELGGSARVDGNVLALSGQMNWLPGAQVAGQLIDLDQTGALASLSGLLHELSPGATSSISRISLSLLLALATFLLVLVLVWRWPRRTEGIVRVMLMMPVYSLLLGLLTIFLLVAGFVLLAMVLALTLIGLPLVLGLGAVLQLPAILGLTVLAMVVGRLLVGRAGSASWQIGTLSGALVVLLPLTLLGSIAPIWAMLLFYLLASPGLGAVIISRGGYLPRAEGRM